MSDTDSTAKRPRITTILSKSEIQRLTQKSDLMGGWAIVSTWGGIALIFALIAWSWQQSLIVAILGTLAGVALLGGRQLALAILTHEACHKTLFNTQWANDVLTDWLCGRPIALDLQKYRAHHFIHHTQTGTPEDSDISLIAGLPTTRASLRRKFTRDLLGITGAKFLLGRILMDAGIQKWTVAADVTWLPQTHRRWYHQLGTFCKNAYPTLLTNLALYFMLAAAGFGELYWAWIAAYLIPYPLFIRIRALAEHAVTEQTPDVFRNTRTTRAGLLARTFIAPFNVNFHIEHHAMASVPYFRLPEFHRILRVRKITPEPPSYRTVLKQVSSA
ncbi:fatty acid desaturase [Oleiphilus messinensis]|uniref:Fatty acid desaturase n=1 Tax=Oleiphilus messinensis TaxID=141451 RepID=A0A1Y0IHB1_9GAMM|nr:fatty acid desaturase family protein [Oleiphilus messinensis]ARU59529.1 fatty acid desaturase [Oleiphilus messinensis]